MQTINLMTANTLISYDPKEELINAYSNGIGAALALVASILLIIKGQDLALGQWISLWVYGFSLVLLLSS